MIARVLFLHMCKNLRNNQIPKNTLEYQNNERIYEYFNIHFNTTMIIHVHVVLVHVYYPIYRYFVRVVIVRRISDLVKEHDIAVHTLSSYPDLINRYVVYLLSCDDHVIFEIFFYFPV